MGDPLTPGQETTTEKADAILDALASLRAEVRSVGVEVSALKNHVRIQNGRVGTLEGRLNRTSDGVKANSSHDLEHDARLADEIIARQRIEADVAATKLDVASTKALLLKNNAMTSEIVTAVGGWLNSPKGKVLRGLVWTAVVAWLASK